MRGFEPWQASIGLGRRPARPLRRASSSGANRFKACGAPRSSGSAWRAAGVFVAALRAQPLGRLPAWLVSAPLVLVASAASSCWPAPRRPRWGFLADISEAHPGRPGRDHGPLLGVPGPRPDHRRLLGGARGRMAGHRRPAGRVLGLLLSGPPPARPLRATRASVGRRTRRWRREPGPYGAPGRIGILGAPMRLSRLFFTSLRDDPADAEMASHRLLVRAGYVRQLGSGIYSLLPLGFRGQPARRAGHPRGDGRHRRAGDGDAGRPSRRPVAGSRGATPRSAPRWSASRTAAGATWCWP